MITAQSPLRILVCTKMDLAGALILNTLLPRLADCKVMVLMSEKTRPVENTVPELAEIKFFERDLPMDILFPLLDRADASKARLQTFAALSARYGITIESITDLNGPDGEARIRAFAPDLTISARFSLIFKPNTYDIPRWGTYNVHPGALPRYAGLFAPFRCMLDGSESIGCTLHRVDKGIDTGPIVGIGHLPIDRRRSLLWHVVNTYRPGLDLFLDMLDGLRRGQEPHYQAQDFSQRQYVSLPGAEPFAQFKAKGLKLLEAAEYLEILSGFLPPDMAMPGAVANAVANGRGDACCSVPA
ncbi:Methionyl-tRNA formyltransferase [Paramagnetospirillum magnetotacticum MS-1]|uniref:Methionyl-tRNA formyltransferase n=1 Tax=Paramagnetospirillum magnetotacticum MS-1 TaxID=272627 RepID=A0A0C2UCU9_PARME|nr:formyl transferase [Paramagnetospirillum magnetotacticum]KIL99337.1 Methionyl-tRNA formyltransferase [Paramagnetospirillum magnetotacticum MS-1]